MKKLSLTFVVIAVLILGCKDKSGNNDIERQNNYLAEIIKENKAVVYNLWMGNKLKYKKPKELYDNLMNITDNLFKHYYSKDINWDLEIKKIEDFVKEIKIEKYRVWEDHIHKKIFSRTEFIRNVKSGNDMKMNYVLTLLTELSFRLVDFNSRFNSCNPTTFEPYIELSKTNYNVNDSLFAKIFLQAIDTTSNPDIKVDGKTIKVKNGVGIFSKKLNNKGKFKFTGRITILYEQTHDSLSFVFEKKYIVK